MRVGSWTSKYGVRAISDSEANEIREGVYSKSNGVNRASKLGKRKQ